MTLKQSAFGPRRRRFLAGALTAALAAATAPFIAAAAQPLPPSRAKRVVIAGGGWGGLSAARHLRDLLPDAEIVLIERNAAFWSCPLSNRWLAGLVDARMLSHDYAAAAAAYGYRYLRAEIQAVERDRRRVVTNLGALDYDWLVLAPGIRHHYEAWFGDERRAIDHARSRYPCAYTAGDEFPLLRQKLDRLAGGKLLMTLPPMPYRCPPAPYERAMLVAWMMKTRGIKGRLTVVDPNSSAQGFQRGFERYREYIEYLPDRRIRSVDPFQRRLVTEVEELRFDDAILMPPQQAGDLLWQAGLIGKDAAGNPTGWAAQDALSFQAQADERVFIVGDALGPVSTLFGHYPKSGHMANRQARIVAREIAARAGGKPSAPLLPEGVCHVMSDFDPLEMLRIDTRYRVRGDGLIEQTVKQQADPNPRGEDIAWAGEMFAEFLAYKP